MWPFIAAWITFFLAVLSYIAIVRMRFGWRSQWPMTKDGKPILIGKRYYTASDPGWYDVTEIVFHDRPSPPGFQSCKPDYMYASTNGKCWGCSVYAKYHNPSSGTPRHAEAARWPNFYTDPRMGFRPSKETVR